ncbi:hypothetical protein EJ110_NYTH27738, partial [Nymphaea thermarum]
RAGEISPLDASQTTSLRSSSSLVPSHCRARRPPSTAPPPSRQTTSLCPRPSATVPSLRRHLSATVAAPSLCYCPVLLSPRSFFGVEDFVDDDNERPYTYKKEKKSKNPHKHISFKQRTIAYMEPFTLDVFISKRFVSASLTHRVSSKQVAVAGTNSKDIKAILKSRCDIPACMAVGRILADRAREADVYTASYTPRDRDKFEGKIRAVVQSLIDSGIDVKVYPN